VVAVAAVSAVFALTAVPAGEAARPRAIASYCSDSGDVCFGALNRGGAVSLEIDTVARYFDRYVLCVQPPRGASTCRSFPMRTSGGFYASNVRWHRSFPGRGPGTYTVTWRLRGTALGPSLRFRLPLS
jgi:hypothetical protein